MLKWRSSHKSHFQSHSASKKIVMVIRLVDSGVKMGFLDSKTSRRVILRDTKTRLSFLLFLKGGGHEDSSMLFRAFTKSQTLFASSHSNMVSSRDFRSFFVGVSEVCCENPLYRNYKRYICWKLCSFWQVHLLQVYTVATLTKTVAAQT